VLDSRLQWIRELSLTHLQETLQIIRMGLAPLHDHVHLMKRGSRDILIWRVISIPYLIYSKDCVVAALIQIKKEESD
jgi:hypothetical protein